MFSSMTEAPFFMNHGVAREVDTYMQDLDEPLDKEDVETKQLADIILNSGGKSKNPDRAFDWLSDLSSLLKACNCSWYMFDSPTRLDVNANDECPHMG